MKKQFVAIGVVLLAGIFMAGCSNKVSQEWFNYGNGCINLSTVSHISSEMTFSLMDNNGQGVWSANQEPITKENVNKIINAIKQYQGKWTSVSCGASIHFDNFTLTLFTLESAGLPTTDEGCIKLVNYWLSEYNKVIHYIKARTI